MNGGYESEDKPATEAPVSPIEAYERLNDIANLLRQAGHPDYKYYRLVLNGYHESEKMKGNAIRLQQALSLVIDPAPRDRLVQATRQLREAQKAYMADRGNELLGKAVGAAAVQVDQILDSFSCVKLG